MQSNPRHHVGYQGRRNATKNSYGRANQTTADNFARQPSTNPAMVNGFGRHTNATYKSHHQNSASKRFNTTRLQMQAPPYQNSSMLQREMYYSYVVQAPPPPPQPTATHHQHQQQTMVVNSVNIQLNTANAMSIQPGKLYNIPPAAGSQMPPFAVAPMVVHTKLAAAQPVKAPTYATISNQPSVPQRTSIQKKPRRHALEIKHPVTGRNILEDLYVDENITTNNITEGSSGTHTTCDSATANQPDKTGIQFHIETVERKEVSSQPFGEAKTLADIQPVADAPLNCLPPETLSQNLTNGQVKLPQEQTVPLPTTTMSMSCDNFKGRQEDQAEEDTKESCSIEKCFTATKEEAAVFNFSDDQKILKLKENKNLESLQPPELINIPKGSRDEQEEMLAQPENSNSTATKINSNCNQLSDKNNTNENKISPTKFAKLSIKNDDDGDEKLDKAPAACNIKKAPPKQNKPKKTAKKKKTEADQKCSPGISKPSNELKQQDADDKASLHMSSKDEQERIINDSEQSITTNQELRENAVAIKTEEDACKRSAAAIIKINNNEGEWLPANSRNQLNGGKKQQKAAAKKKKTETVTKKNTSTTTNTKQPTEIKLKDSSEKANVHTSPIEYLEKQQSVLSGSSPAQSNDCGDSGASTQKLIEQAASLKSDEEVSASNSDNIEIEKKKRPSPPPTSPCGQKQNTSKQQATAFENEENNAATSSMDGLKNDLSTVSSSAISAQINEKKEEEIAASSNQEQRQTANEEDQTSACARIRYTREQLMQLRRSKASLVVPNIKNSLIYSQTNLMPSFAVRANMSFGAAAGGPRSRSDNYQNWTRTDKVGQHHRNNDKDIIHVDLSLNQDVKLNEAQNAWRPRMMAKLPDTEMDDEQRAQHEKEEIIRRVRGILNKLTPEKFEPLVEEIVGLKINTLDKMKSVMLLVFEKAVDEPNFSLSYATLCQRLASEIKANDAQVESGATSNLAIFHRALLAKAEFEFKQNVTQSETKEAKLLPIKEKISQCTDANEKVELHALLELEEKKLRRRSGGTVRFIGELFKLSMLTGKIINSCLECLVKDPQNEDMLECLCKLLTTVGQKFEQTNVSRENPSKFSLDSMMQRIQNIAAKKEGSRVSSRIRFMLLDVIDLRKMNWQTKRNETPKPIEQIEKEANEERMRPSWHEMEDAGSLRNDNNGRNVYRNYGGRGSQSSDSSGSGQQFDGAFATADSSGRNAFRNYGGRDGQQGGGAGAMGISNNRRCAENGNRFFAFSRE